MKKAPSRPIDASLLEGRQFTVQDSTALDTPERILTYFRSNGFIDGNYTDIEGAIAANPELSIKFDDLGENDAYLKKIGEKQFEIGINKKHSKTRQRFSMAHEYVHYQIHRNAIDNLADGEQILHRNWERDEREYQANELAGEILMPRESFVRSVRKFNGSMPRLPQEFQVSPQALRMRAARLGFLING